MVNIFNKNNLKEFRRFMGLLSTAINYLNLKNTSIIMLATIFGISND